MVYTGRFAPSPTGPLHFGSLLAALASFLDARAHQGRWLIRIEDLDPPREIVGASDSILRTLEQFGFEWDGPVWYQSQRHPVYHEILEQLLHQNNAYRCSCSRQEIIKRTGSSVYDGYCRTHSADRNKACAIRCHCSNHYAFQDRILGLQDFSSRQDDFVIFRRDGYFAYQLAVTIDDAEQQISHVVRGSDLLDSTPKQLQLQHLLNYPQPEYAHIPVATNSQGQKLSKQTFADALNDQQPVPQLIQALNFLNQQPPAELTEATTSECLNWAVQHWNITAIPAQLGITLEGH
ncbi:tRNA glutamyl-Q(34) synthetase GluQRS [Amphritea balenae]|uniref:Glutamyl-Q tRNA(Asp) synthetase n=1 Tax=Amphritea balenae TaxID=452629 RepID=A0A3P1SI47_9GAMM|nr:tRNA glutamyl-Q(34) synthetase GluQRS [Amphritea balenae]RRC96951.1 tRNA glutamyl-Q(34) synthetase GluQRS [Amphritea balenae]GGK85386.1 glutamyl-Q tRNA(Asp) synthetase [Amphritea balenae]